MAHRHRDVLSTVVDRENLIARPTTKVAPTKLISQTRRPALDELSNRLIQPTKPAAKKPEPGPAAKKPEPIKDHKPAPKAAQPPKKENEPPVKSYSSTLLGAVAENTPETSNDPQMVTEYLGDIFQYLRDLETKHPIREKFLEKHRSTPRMRAILVNWLVEVHLNFSLCLETLHMCVSILDRYLQDNTNVGSESLQLVGVSSLLIACKYEEMYFPDVKDFEYICDNTFSVKEILKMEMSILVSLDCSLGKPLSIQFLRRYSKLANVRLEQHNLAKYLLELALLDHNLSQIRPSVQAAAACCLSVAILTNATVTCPSKVWTPFLVQETELKYSDFKPVLIKFAEMLQAADSSKLKHIPKKYANAKLSKISTHPKLKGPWVKKLIESSSKTS